MYPYNLDLHSYSLYSNILDVQIQTEAMFQDALIQQYRSIYQGSKYNDIDIMKESHNVTKMITNTFFNQYMNFFSTKTSKMVGLLKSRCIQFDNIYKSINKNDITPVYNVQQTLYTYDRTIPNFKYAINSLEAISDDYNIFISKDINKINNLFEDISTPDDINDHICDCKSTSEIAYKLRNKGKLRYVNINAEYFSDMKKKKNIFSSYIKDIEENINTFTVYADKLINCIKTHDNKIQIYVNSVDEFDEFNPVNSFYKYELRKMYYIINAIGDTILAKINMVNDEITENINYIQKYTNSTIVINHKGDDSV